MSDDYMSEADNEMDGGYFADLEYEYQQKEIRRQEDKENKAKKEENRKQQLLEQNKCIENLKAKLERKNQQINQLKQQLAEKDKEIERLKEITIFKDSRNMTTKINGVDFSDEQIIILQNLDILKKYDQSQLAIQELEKVKDFAFENTMLGIETVAVINQIDQQIKELKGE